MLFLAVRLFMVILAVCLAIPLMQLTLYILLKLDLVSFLLKNVLIIIMTIVVGWLLSYLAMSLVDILLLVVLWLIKM